jgi:hypothetical protein
VRLGAGDRGAAHSGPLGGELWIDRDPVFAGGASKRHGWLRSGVTERGGDAFADVIEAFAGKLTA